MPSKLAHEHLRKRQRREGGGAAGHTEEGAMRIRGLTPPATIMPALRAFGGRGMGRSGGVWDLGRGLRGGALGIWPPLQGSRLFVLCSPQGAALG